jgi:hypothetical protein
MLKIVVLIHTSLLWLHERQRITANSMLLDEQTLELIVTGLSVRSVSYLDALFGETRE